MKPHPRIRTFFKWGGAGATLLLTLLWFSSAWLGAYAYFGRHLGMSAGNGTLEIRWFPEGTTESLPGWWIVKKGSEFRWWFEVMDTKYWKFLFVPLWLPIPLILFPTIVAWRLDSLPRRRANAGNCPTCKYSRAGLAADALCPECGTPPPVVPPAAP